MNRFLTLCVISVLASCPPSPLRAGPDNSEPPRAAKNGKTDYVIVEAAAPTAAEAFAAKELARFVERSTRATLPLTKEPDFKGGTPALFVGQTALAGKQGIDFSKQGPEEWVMRSVGNNLIIAGGRPRGTLYGVYEFLERYVGVRFLDAHTEFVPSCQALSFPANLAVQAEPAFFRREIFMVTPHHPEQVLFQVRRKINAFGNAAVASAGPELGFSVLFGSPYSTHTHHLYAKHFPVDKPEYFALTAPGTRTGPGPDGQVCMSHPDVRRLFASRMREYIRQDRERTAKAASGEPFPFIYDLTPNDNGNKCLCDRCKALAAKYGAYSGVVLEFTNAIAQDIAKDHPEVLVQTAAYTFYMDPPQGIVPRDNVMVRVAQLGTEFTAAPKRDTLRSMLHPVNAEARAMLEARAKVSKTLGVHDYWTAWNQPFQWPHANVHGLARTLRLYHQCGVRDYFVEDELMGSRLHNFVDLQFYLASRLLVDPSQDERPIIAEFMKLYYGPAAPAMTRLLDYIEKRQEEEPGMLASVTPAMRKYLDARFFVETDALLREAEGAVAGDAKRPTDIRQERLAIDETMLYLWNRLNQDGRFPFQRQQVLDRLRQSYSAAYRKYGGWGSEKADADRLEYLRNMPPVPPQFAGKKIIDLCGPQLDLRQAGGNFARRAEDPEATLGKAWRLDAAMQGPPGQHDKTPEFGLYDNKSKQLANTTLTGRDVPKDEKYHFHCAGRMKGSANLYFWAHHSWRLSQHLNMTYNSALPEQVAYDVYASIKLEGPAYVPGSTRTNAMSIDRLILVEVNSQD
jgi:hypothetical protein